MSRLARIWVSILVVAVLVGACGGSAAAPTALERKALNLGEPTENLGFRVTVLKNEQDCPAPSKVISRKSRCYTRVEGEVENRGSVAAGVQLEATIRQVCSRATARSECLGTGGEDAKGEDAPGIGEPDVFWPAKAENIAPGSKKTFSSYLEPCEIHWGGDLKITTPEECQVTVEAIKTQVFD